MSGQPSAVSASSMYVNASSGIGVDRLVEQALSKNANILAVRQGIAEAEGLLRQAGFRVNPSFDVTVNAGPAFGISGPSEQAVGYSHVFELGGKRKRRVEVSQRGLELARLTLANEERQLRADVQSRYVEALAAAKNLEIVDRQLKLSQEILRVTTLRVEQGEAPRLDRGLLAVEVGRLQSDRLLFENQVQRAIFAIRPLIGMEPDAPLQLAGDLNMHPLAATVEATVAKALAERPDLLAAQKEKELRDAETNAARAEATPNLITSARYARSNDNLGQFGYNAAGGRVPIIDIDHTVSLGMSINLPFRNRNQGQIQASIARSDAAGLRKKYVEQVITQEVRSAYARYQTAQQALALYDRTIISQAQDNLRVIQLSYSAGEVRLFDVLNEQRRLTDTQRAYTDVLRESYLSTVDLERAIGGPLP